MSEFDNWWSSVYRDKPKEIHRQCFEEGFDRGYADGAASVRVLRYAVVGVLALSAVFILAGCEDQYRYKCQNPDHFNAPECQKPKCLFTQMCPEYLVAPILKDQINAQNTQPSPEAAPNR
jgi:hypothetical protein